MTALMEKIVGIALFFLMGAMYVHVPSVAASTLPGRSIELNIDEAPEILQAHLKKATRAQKITFYEAYLGKYYPRALVIRSHFLANMTPERIDQALHEIVLLLKTDPAFYFVDPEKRVKIGFYWEAIVDQLSLVSEFLKKAYVDLSTQELFLLEPLMFGVGSSHLNCTFLRTAKRQTAPMKLLLTYMREKRLVGPMHFYATYFDYVIKLFIEGVLFKDTRQVQRYQHELEFVITKLRGTEFERLYQEPLNVCKELVTILYAQLGGAAEDDDGEDDEGLSSSQPAGGGRG